MRAAVHLRVPHHLASGRVDELAPFVARVEAGPLDGLAVGDHVSFHDGTGYDGLVQATALATLSRRLTVWTAVYLLALRHPVTVARQVASLAALAPSRFVFGVGLGGDDPHELEVCGVDPRLRGRCFDACLDIVRPLLEGATVTSDYPDLTVPGAVIKPVPDPSVPIVIGGRSDAALRRVGRIGDGWTAVWHSPARVAAGIARVEEVAAEHGRRADGRGHAYTVWCGFGADSDAARDRLAARMETLYRRPFSSFERYCPCGTPAQVAAALAPYLDVGIGELIVIGDAASDDELIDAAEELTAELQSRG